MAQAGFGGVSDDALVGFEQALTDGPWSAVDAADWLPRKSGKVKLLADAPVLVFHKVMMLTAVHGLAAVLATGAGRRKVLDEAWDEEQRTLDLELQLRERAKNPAPVREAAARVRTALLSAGRDQINYDDDKEVEFGRKQVVIARAKELSADIAKLHLGDVVAAIETTTEALAVGTDYGTKKKEERSPGRRALAAQRHAAGACNAAYETLTALLDRTPAGESPDATLLALKGALDALLARRETAPSPVAPPAAPPAAEQPPPKT